MVTGYERTYTMRFSPYSISEHPTILTLDCNSENLIILSTYTFASFLLLYFYFNLTFVSVPFTLT